MSDDIFDTDLDDDELDEDELEDDHDMLDQVISKADERKHKSLVARRRIENLMELRALREIDESIRLEDLE